MDHCAVGVGVGVRWFTVGSRSRSRSKMDHFAVGIGVEVIWITMQ